MIYAITTNDFAKTTNKVAKAFGEVAKTDKKVAKSVVQFATFNIKVQKTDNFIATLDVNFAKTDNKVATNEIKYKNDKIKIVPSHRTRSSTFAIRTKPTRKPKIAKELALLAPRIDTFCHLETFDFKTINKINPAANKRSYAIGGLVVRQVQYPQAKFVTGDRFAATKSPTAHTADRYATL